MPATGSLLIGLIATIPPAVSQGATLEEGLVSLLTLETSNTYAKVGARVSAHPLNQSERLPAVTYQVISTRHGIAYDGATGLAMARIQINCWAEAKTTKLEDNKEKIGANEVAEAVRLDLDGFEGLMGDVTVCRVHMSDGGGGDLPGEKPPSSRGQWRFGVRQDVEIIYQETVPSF